MNTLQINHVKIEKGNAILRYSQLRKITNLFRIIEIFLFLAMISRVSFQLPQAFKLSGEYFHDFFVVLVSPRFVFIVGNAIIIILFAKSGHFRVKNPSSNQAVTASYEQEYMQKQVKQSLAEESTVMASIFPSSEAKTYHRSKSEKLRRKVCDKNCCELRRSSTVNTRKCCKYCQETGEAHYPEDHMTTEEFRQTVEAFIAKQQRFLREEEFSSTG
ncbi:hypothetical protein Nepgr_020017 [Nepenthes gracilis]|uniref:DUF4408 domain-containing protein n=1 Tax=Nepenthes gracilis TaxID=150966 RepID=A0AAD3SWI9_NEPGR|nr:hypothetical protein Nepgr_020017 [Nepenthes gracilis]